MIISHDRQTLFIGVPKHGSQTARAVLGQVGVDLVGKLGRIEPVDSATMVLMDILAGRWSPSSWDWLGD